MCLSLDLFWSILGTSEIERPICSLLDLPWSIQGTSEIEITIQIPLIQTSAAELQNIYYLERPEKNLK